MKGLFILAIVIGAITMAFVSGKTTEKEQNSFMQGNGIEFQSLDYEAAIIKAKTTGKLVFIDSYTEWCGPCKKMAATAFKDENVAKVFNPKFINIKIEMERSVDGPQVAKMFGVRAYPTLLFVNGDGKLVKSIVGYQTPEQLLAIGKSM